MAPLHRTVAVDRHRPRRPGDWVLSDTLVDAGGRQITAAREDLAVLHAQQAGHRPAHVPRHARLEAHHLVPAGGPLLDVPADRGRPLRRARRRDRARRALARAPDAGVTTRASTAASCFASPPAPRPSAPSECARLLARRLPAAAPALAVRLRQPRADEPVLRAGEERQPRRRRAARRRRSSGRARSSSDVGEMVKAMRHAIDARRRRDRRLDHRPGRRSTARPRVALEHGIPVVAYNADGGKANKRLAYIGQDNYQSGLELGARVAAPRRQRRRLPLHRDAAASRTSSRGSTARSTRSATRAGRSARTSSRAASTSRRSARRSRRPTRRTRSLRGLFAVDAGSTAGRRAR